MRLFGDSNLSCDNTEYSQLKRFTHSDSKLSSLGKMILNFSKHKNKFYIYNAHIANALLVDPNLKYSTLNGNIYQNINDNELAELNHYRNKTYQECYTRKFNNTDVAYGYINRVHNSESGRINKDVFDREFTQFNKNDIENTTARDWFYNN